MITLYLMGMLRADVLQLPKADIAAASANRPGRAASIAEPPLWTPSSPRSNAVMRDTDSDCTAESLLHELTLPKYISFVSQ